MKNHDQPKRKAGSAPYASRRYTYSPPARGNMAASSATVSAPHSEITPPRIHTSATPPTLPASVATVLGTRKMPLPMVSPTAAAIALHRPSRRGSRSSARSAPSGAGWDGRGGAAVDM
jgi:hypothetical protein